MFIHPENQTILWDIINESPLFLHIPLLEREQWFRSIIAKIYTEHRDMVDIRTCLPELNRKTVIFMMKTLHEISRTSSSASSQNQHQTPSINVSQHSTQSIHPIQPSIPAIASSNGQVNFSSHFASAANLDIIGIPVTSSIGSPFLSSNEMITITSPSACASSIESSNIQPHHPTDYSPITEIPTEKKQAEKMQNLIFEQRQKEYVTMLGKQTTPDVNFNEPIEDKPIVNINELIEIQKRERENIYIHPQPQQNPQSTLEQPESRIEYE